MSTIFFDTLEVFDGLKSSGFTEAQARGLSEALKKSQEFGIKDLATKSDLTLLKTELEAKFEKDIEKAKSEMLKWNFLFWIGQLAAMVALFKFFRA